VVDWSVEERGGGKLGSISLRVQPQPKWEVVEGEGIVSGRKVGKENLTNRKGSGEKGETIKKKFSGKSAAKAHPVQMQETREASKES